jgi:PPOX class probable F420-dependent enzyme
MNKLTTKMEKINNFGGPIISDMNTKLNENSLKILRGKNFAFLATVGRDGYPQVTPVWVDTDGENVLINTAVGRVKEKNLSRDPRVTVSVPDWTNPYSFVTIQGTIAKKTTGKEADDHIDKLAKKYTGADKYGSRQPGEKRVMFAIKPRRILQH